jgi:hypothetical protein
VAAVQRHSLTSNNMNKRKKVTGGWRKLYTEELGGLHEIFPG